MNIKNKHNTIYPLNPICFIIRGMIRKSVVPVGKTNHVNPSNKTNFKVFFTIINSPSYHQTIPFRCNSGILSA